MGQRERKREKRSKSAQTRDDKAHNTPQPQGEKTAEKIKET
jgi:hypothetical protein